MSDQWTTAAAIAALRNPPPEVIEAGAKASFLLRWYPVRDKNGEGERVWNTMDQQDRKHHCHAWLASWQAGIDAGMVWLSWRSPVYSAPPPPPRE